MAAGLGFKTFASGDVLSAADTNGYLMQGVLVFASAAARDAAITSPQEGQFAYLKDTNVTTYYTGSAWANLDTTGMTNPMTTTGDTIYSSSGSTPARLGIGSTGQVLTVAGGIPSWATASGWSPNYQLLNSGGTALTGATTVTVSGISGINSLYIIIDGVSSASVSSLMQLLLNSDTGANYQQVTHQIKAATPNEISADYSGLWGNSIYFATLATNAAGVARVNFQIDGTGTAGLKTINFTTFADAYANTYMQIGHGAYKGTSAISSVTVKSSNGNLDAGTIYVYGA